MPEDLTQLLRPTPAALDTTSLTRPGETARRPRFRGQWARFPLSWLVALRGTRSGYVWQVALEILFAEFRRQHAGGGIVLSEAATGVPHPARWRAIRVLVRLGLIEVERDGRRAVRVTLVNVRLSVNEQPDDR